MVNQHYEMKQQILIRTLHSFHVISLCTEEYAYAVIN